MSVITRAEALKISKDYVAFAEGDFSAYDKIEPAFSKLKRGKPAITYYEGKFHKVTVSSVDNKSYRAIDGPVVRVKDERMSWRVDGSGYAFPID